MVEKVSRFFSRMTKCAMIYRFLKSCLFMISQAALLALIAYILSSLLMKGNLMDYGKNAFLSFYDHGHFFDVMCDYFPVTFACEVESYAQFGRKRTMLKNTGLCSFIYNLVNAQVLLCVWTYFGLLCVLIAYYFVWDIVKSNAWERRRRIKSKCIS